MAANQAAIQVTFLKDILLSEEEILKRAERGSIFQMQDKEENSLGYIILEDLKAYVHEHVEEVEDYQVRNIDAFDWTPLFEHPFFQRRKPQLVPTPKTKANSDVLIKSNERTETPVKETIQTSEKDDDQQFFILRHGQKTGPFTSKALTTMLDDKELLLTDMVSYNAGHTWMKLFQVDSFDRRILKESDQLPGLPAKTVMEALDNVIPISPETEAMSSLAYLSNVKRGKIIEREKIETYQSDAVSKKSGGGLYKWLLIVSVVGIAFFVYHIKNQLSSPFKAETQTLGEQAEMLTPVELETAKPVAPGGVGEKNLNSQINDQGRTGGKFKARTLMNPVRPNRNRKKSFMESAKYQVIKNADTANPEDPNYFYDNSSPMELDPVRSQVSKENYDNGGSNEGPIPSSDNLFESEVSN